MMRDLPFEKEEERLKSLLIDLSLLELDYKLEQNQLQPVCLLSYTELYRYIYPVLEYLNSFNKDLYFTRQLALRYFMDFRKVEWRIGYRAFNKYKEDLKYLSKRMELVLTDPSLNWGPLVDSAQEYHEKSLKQSKSIEKLERAGLIIDREPIKNAMINALKAVVLKHEYADGISTFEELIQEKKVLRFSPETELSLERHSRYNELKSTFHNNLNVAEFNTRSEAKTANVDIAAKLVLLNKKAAKDKKFFVLIAEKNDLNPPLEKLSLPETIDPNMNWDSFPVIRSLNYCLFDAYLRTYSTSYETLLNRIQKLKRLVSLSRKVIQEPGQHQQIDKLLKRIPVLRVYFKELEDKLRDRLGMHSDRGGFLVAERLKSVLNELLNEPTKIFDVYDDFDNTIDKAIAKIGQIQDIPYEKSKEETIYGIYSTYALTAYEKPYEKKILGLYDELTVIKIGDSKKLSLFEKKVDDFRKQINDTPALYVILSICARRRKLFREAHEYLLKAESMKPDNPEVFFNRSILIRMRADYESSTEISKVDLLQKAIEHARKAVESPNTRPMFFQHTAYLHWRIYLTLNEDSFDELSDQAKLHIREAANYLNLAKARHPQLLKSTNAKISCTIDTELAYYLALMGNETELLEAFKLVNGIQIHESHMSPPQLDSKAFVYYKYAIKLELEKTEKIRLLEESIKIYLTCLVKRPDLKITAEGLTKAYTAFKVAGGTAISV